MPKSKKKKKKQADPVNFVEPVRGPQRLKQLVSVAEKCNKAMGASGAVYLGKDQREFERVSSGITALDYVTGGGLVRGQMVQFTGEDGSFKTTAALIAAAKRQAEDETVVWLAGEGFDKKWARKWGVDLDKLIVISADTGDSALEAAMTLIDSKLVDLMVFDSFQSLGTTREMEDSIEQESYGGAGAPAMWGRLMRKCYAAMNRGAAPCLVGISQVRAPIGRYGVTEPQGTGVWALKHWKAIEIYFKKGEMDLEGEANEKRKLSGREFKLRCLKNKTAVSERQASFSLRKKDGDWKIDNVGTIFRLANAYELFNTKGAWVDGYGIRAQGAAKYIAELRKSGKTQRKILKDIYEAIA